MTLGVVVDDARGDGFGGGALAWHRTVPYADSLVLPTHLVRLACRWELGLPLPRLLDAVRENRLCACCGLPVTDVTGHHFLTTSQPRETQQTFGGYYDTHHAVMWALASSLREAGFVVASTGCLGSCRLVRGRGRSSRTSTCVGFARVLRVFSVTSRSCTR
jgi:hypothetical protein